MIQAEIKRRVIRWLLSFPILIALGCAEGVEQGSIDATLTCTPLSIEEMGDMSYVADMPMEVTKDSLLLDFSVIDSTTNWSRFELPFSSHIELERQFDSLVILQAIGQRSENPVVFDGSQWILYWFMHNWFDSNWFNIDGWAWSPNHGLLFGTNALAADRVLGAQGICRLNKSGKVERIFWPPFIKRWKDMVRPSTLPFDVPYVLAWNILDLRYSDDSVLWAGMWQAVVRLDLGASRWRLYDDSNSDIRGGIIHIAPIENTGAVRCVSVPDPNNPGSRGVRVFKIQDFSVTEEKIPERMRRVLGSNLSTLTSDRFGTLYVSDHSTLWEIGQGKHERVISFPVKRCDDYFIDSSGRIWITKGTRLWVQDGKGWREVSQDLPLQGDETLRITAFFEDPKGRLWICWDTAVSEPSAPFATILGKKAREKLNQSLAPGVQNTDLRVPITK